MNEDIKSQEQLRQALDKELRRVHCEKMIAQFDDLTVEQKDIDFITAIQTSNIAAAQNNILEYIMEKHSRIYYEKAERLAEKAISEAQKAQKKAEVAQWITIAIAVISIVINALIVVSQQ